MASYEVRADRQIKKEIQRLPGHVRQRVIRTLKSLEKTPRPPNSRPLDTNKAHIELGSSTEARRIRINYILARRLPD